jgi:N6-L-threonylcarbamoyladenine synthase
MTKILGIDTSNYTTSAAVVEDDLCIMDARKLLEVNIGKRGLRQSEALFQHLNNLPLLLDTDFTQNIEAICISTRPRPVIGSYMPVFKGGECIARSIAHVLGIKVYETSHQEGHIEAAIRSINFKEKNFIAFHLSGGTTEILKITREKKYSIEIIGGTKDISIGQFIDRIGVAMGYSFPSGRKLDELAMKGMDTGIRIPSRTQNLYMNFSGQETQCLKYIEKGYNHEEVSFFTMKCIAKTLEKTLMCLFDLYNLPVIFMGGVAASKFIKNYLNSKFINGLYFSKENYASDNAVGVAFLGYKSFMED